MTTVHRSIAGLNRALSRVFIYLAITYGMQVAVFELLFGPWHRNVEKLFDGIMRVIQNLLPFHIYELDTILLVIVLVLPIILALAALIQVCLSLYRLSQQSADIPSVFAYRLAVVGVLLLISYLGLPVSVLGMLLAEEDFARYVMIGLLLAAGTSVYFAIRIRSPQTTV